MKPSNVAVPSSFERRDLLAARAGLIGVAVASPVLAQTAPAAAVARVKGPAVWLDMDQAELDTAYDQIKYAPNLPQITGRYASNSSGAHMAGWCSPPIGARTSACPPTRSRAACAAAACST